MKKDLTAYLNTHNVISKRQYGFQSNLGTFDALEEFSTYLHKNLDEGKYVLNIFLYFKNAYNVSSYVLV